MAAINHGRIEGSVRILISTSFEKAVDYVTALLNIKLPFRYVKEFYKPVVFIADLKS